MVSVVNVHHRGKGIVVNVVDVHYRGKGIVVNVSSIGAAIPHPLLNVYAASKVSDHVIKLCMPM